MQDIFVMSFFTAPFFMLSRLEGDNRNPAGGGKEGITHCLFQPGMTIGQLAFDTLKAKS